MNQKVKNLENDYNRLFRAGEAIASQQELSSLWNTASGLLEKLSQCEIIHLVLCDQPDRGTDAPWFDSTSVLASSRLDLKPMYN